MIQSIPVISVYLEVLFSCLIDLPHVNAHWPQDELHTPSSLITSLLCTKFYNPAEYRRKSNSVLSPYGLCLNSESFFLTNLLIVHLLGPRFFSPCFLFFSFFLSKEGDSLRLLHRKEIGRSASQTPWCVSSSSSSSPTTTTCRICTLSSKQAPGLLSSSPPSKCISCDKAQPPLLSLSFSSAATRVL